MLDDMLCWLSAPHNHACGNKSKGRCDRLFDRVDVAFGMSIEIALGTRADAQWNGELGVK